MCNKIKFSLSRLRVPEDVLIPLSKRDESKLNSLLKRPYLTSQPGWQNEVRDGNVKELRNMNIVQIICLPNKVEGMKGCI